jgi:hypothetical protein
MSLYVCRLTEQADLAGVLLVEHRSLDKGRRAAHITKRDRFESLWRSIIQRGIELGDFRVEDSRLTTFALLGVLNWTITWFDPEGEFTAEKIADFYADLFLKGMLAIR